MCLSCVFVFLFLCTQRHIKKIEHNKLIVHLILNEDCYFLFRIAA